MYCQALETSNRMSSSSLATIFLTHLVCPRWLEAQELQDRYNSLAKLTTFMVEEVGGSALCGDSNGGLG